MYIAIITMVVNIVTATPAPVAPKGCHYQTLEQQGSPTAQRVLVCKAGAL